MKHFSYMKFRDKIFLNLYDQYHNIQKSTLNLNSIAVEITRQCNLQCKHCYMNSKIKDSNDELTTKEWVNFFKNIKKHFGNKVEIKITGGEPLIRKDFFEILKGIKELEFKKISIATNGLLINDKNVKTLKKLLTGISISLDGFELSHNYLRSSETYQKTLEKIRLLIKNNFSYIVIKTTIFKNNIADIDNFYNFISNMGIDKWHIIPMEPLGRGKINKNEILSLNQYLELCNFFDKIKKNASKMKVAFEEQNNFLSLQKTCDLHCYKRCGAGIDSFAVLYNGDIIDCIQDNRDNLVKYGNIKNENIKLIWLNKFSEKRKKSYKFCDNHYFINILKNQNEKNNI